MKLNQFKPLSFATLAMLAVVILLGFRGQWTAARDQNQESESQAANLAKPAQFQPSDAHADEPKFEQSANDALALLNESILFLRTHNLRSNIRQRGFLFEKEILSYGTYLQSEGGHGSRLEMEMETENLKLNLRVFNDGVYFYRQIFPTGDSNQSTLVSSSPEKKSTASKPSPDSLQRTERINLRLINTEFSHHASWPGHWISYGGIYLFIDQFRRSFAVSTVDTKVIKNREYAVVRGVWKPEKLALLIPSQKRSILSNKTLSWEQIPPQIPMEIEIYFHASGPLKAFPFRIVFYRPENEVLEGYKQIPILVTEFSNTRIVEKPESTLFQFNADENEVHDITEEFITSFRR